MGILKMFNEDGKIDVKYYHRKLRDDLMKNSWTSWELTPVPDGTTKVNPPNGSLVYMPALGPTPPVYTK